MSEPKHNFHGGKRGAAIAVRVIPRSSRNEIAEVMSDGSVKIRLDAPTDDKKLNTTLIAFLSGILEVSASNIEIIGGEFSHSKLITVLDLDSGTAQERIIQNIAWIFLEFSALDVHISR
ncbi:MAG: DUF167 domain-containing protein [Anaerolineae bacterium]|nr:DUF167 domain-containing protein [Anaerolineae bacterium]